MAVFWRTQRESFAPLYWTMVVCNFVLPLILMGIRQVPHDHRLRDRVVRRRRRHVARALPDHRAVARAQVPAVQLRHLQPQPVEIIITVATFAAMALLYVLFAKFVPIISIWELKAGEHPPPELDSAGDRRASARGAAAMKAVYGAVSPTATRRSRRSTACAPPAWPTARSPSSRRSRWRTSSSATSTRPTGSGGSPAAAACSACRPRFGLTLADRDVVADQRRRHADRRLVAEPDHHLRADDARRDPRDGDHAGRHRRPRARRPGCTTPR